MIEIKAHRCAPGFLCQCAGLRRNPIGYTWRVNAISGPSVHTFDIRRLCARNTCKHLPNGFGKDSKPKVFGKDCLPNGFGKDSLPNRFGTHSLPKRFGNDSFTEWSW